MLAWGVALAVFLAGLAIAGQPARRKARYIILVVLLTTLAPLAWDYVELARACNTALFAAALLVPYYLLIGLLKWVCRAVTAPPRGEDHCGSGSRRPRPLCWCFGWRRPPPGLKSRLKAEAISSKRWRRQAASQLPDDVILVPYDVERETGVERAEKLLVPYAKYVELWNRVHPDKKIEARPRRPDACAGRALPKTLWRARITCC